MLMFPLFHVVLMELYISPQCKKTEVKANTQPIMPVPHTELDIVMLNAQETSNTLTEMPTSLDLPNKSNLVNTEIVAQKWISGNLTLKPLPIPPTAVHMMNHTDVQVTNVEILKQLDLLSVIKMVVILTLLDLEIKLSLDQDLTSQLIVPKKMSVVT